MSIEHNGAGLRKLVPLSREIDLDEMVAFDRRPSLTFIDYLDGFVNIVGRVFDPGFDIKDMRTSFLSYLRKRYTSSQGPGMNALLDYNDSYKL